MRVKINAYSILIRKLKRTESLGVRSAEEMIILMFVTAANLLSKDVDRFEIIQYRD
jgi:hypothetical protein